MIEALEWDFEKREYKPYELLDDWTIVLCCDDMETPVNCASCGRKLNYGSTYVSRRIHTKLGLGFPVCPMCYEEECKEEHNSRCRG